jgi:hypothetical protein
MALLIDTRQWYAIISVEEERTRSRIVGLSPAAWRAEATQLIRQTRPNRMASTLAFVRNMDALRAAPTAAPTASRMPEPKTESDADWKLWQEMVEEPAKYGDDIVEWLDLDEKLRAGPKRWRVAAYWLRKEQEEKEKVDALQAPYKALYSVVAKQAATKGMKRWLDRDIKNFIARISGAATKIQAAVRGHQARSKLPFLNCCMCLAHRICPLESQVGMICRECGAQGPYEDITGPVTDPWNWARCDLVDWTRQGQCHCDECQVEEMERCNGCGKWYPEGDMDSCPGYGSYCSRDCGPSGYARDYGWGCD